MSALDWIATFRALHVEAKAHRLAGDALRAYAAHAERFCRALLAAQGLSLGAGESARRSFRIGVIFPLELRHGGKTVKTATLDLSSGGFSTVADLSVTQGELVDFKMKLSSVEEMSGRAKVVGKVSNERGTRVSFAFEGLDAKTQSRFDVCLIDLALARMTE